MSKNLSILPRKPVNEAALRQLEEAVARKADSVAGDPTGLLELPANETAPAAAVATAPAAPAPTAAAPALAAAAPAPVVEEIHPPATATAISEPEQSVSPAPEPSLPKPSVVRPRSQPQFQRTPKVEIPLTGIGTRANPRIRKQDGVKTRSTSVHLPIDLALRLAMFCAREGKRQSEVITQSVADYLDQYDR